MFLSAFWLLMGGKDYSERSVGEVFALKAEGPERPYPRTHEKKGQAWALRQLSKKMVLQVKLPDSPRLRTAQSQAAHGG